MKRTKLTDNIFAVSFWIFITMCVNALIIVICTLFNPELFYLIETYGWYYGLILVILISLMMITDI